MEFQLILCKNGNIQLETKHHTPFNKVQKHQLMNTKNSLKEKEEFEKEHDLG
jgi:hypothetical protein